MQNCKSRFASGRLELHSGWSPSFPLQPALQAPLRMEARRHFCLPFPAHGVRALAQATVRGGSLARPCLICEVHIFIEDYKGDPPCSHRAIASDAACIFSFCLGPPTGRPLRISAFVPSVQNPEGGPEAAGGGGGLPGSQGFESMPVRPVGAGGGSCAATGRPFRACAAAACMGLATRPAQACNGRRSSVRWPAHRGIG